MKRRRRPPRVACLFGCGIYGCGIYGCGGGLFCRHKPVKQ